MMILFRVKDDKTGYALGHNYHKMSSDSHSDPIKITYYYHALVCDQVPAKIMTFPSVSARLDV